MNSYKILWYLNDICNQKCHYCISGLRKTGLNPIISSESLKNLRDCLSLINTTTFEFVLLGGEPTLNTSLLDVVSFLTSEFDHIKIFLVSNFRNGLSSDFYQFKNKLWLRFSMHPQYYTDKWFNFIEEVLNNQFYITCNVMFDTIYRDTVHSILKKIEKYKNNSFFYFDLKRIIPEFSPNYSSNYTDKITNITYTNKDLKFLDENRLVSKIKKNNKKYCLVGSNKIGIDPHGNIFYLCKYNKSIGNIFVIRPILFKKKFLQIRKCPFLSCSCSGEIYPIQSNSKDILVNKEKNFWMNW